MAGTYYVFFFTTLKCAYFFNTIYKSPVSSTKFSKLNDLEAKPDETDLRTKPNNSAERYIRRTQFFFNVINTNNACNIACHFIT